MIKKETINKLISVLLVIVLSSCNQKRESYFLKDQNNNIVEIIRNDDTLYIFEYDKTRKIEWKKLVKINDEYFDFDILKRKRNDANFYLFFSKTKFKYRIINKFSLINDSIIVGNNEGEMYYTEIKSNEKPVNFKFYHSKDFVITKITTKIGKDMSIYE